MQRPLRIVGSAVLTAVFLLVGLGRNPLRAQDGAAAGSPSSREGPSLAVSGFVDRPRAGPGEKVRLWITFLNATEEQIGVRLVKLAHPGLSETGGCWRQGVPVCRTRGGRRPDRLAPDEAVTFYAELSPEGAEGKAALTAVYEWRPDGGALQYGVAAVGDVELTDPWVPSWLPSWLPQALTLLAVPLVLTYVNRRIRSGEQRRAEIQQTWTQMLQKSHENAERYYMPISSALFRLRVGLHVRKSSRPRLRRLLSGLLTGVARPHRPDEEREEQLLLDLLIVLRRQRRLAREIGGWYFKNRLGEEVVAQAWRSFLLLAEKRLGRMQLEQVLDAIEPNDNPGQLARKLAEPALAETGIPSAFRRWLRGGDFRQSCALLHLIEVVLDFEMNRPYERWYGLREPFPAQDFDAAVAALSPWAERFSGDDEPGRGLRALRKRLMSYRAEETRRGITRWRRG